MVHLHNKNFKCVRLLLPSGTREKHSSQTWSMPATSGSSRSLSVPTVTSREPGAFQPLSVKAPNRIGTPRPPADGGHSACLIHVTNLQLQHPPPGFLIQYQGVPMGLDIVIGMYRLLGFKNVCDKHIKHRSSIATISTAFFLRLEKNKGHTVSSHQGNSTWIVHP